MKLVCLNVWGGGRAGLLFDFLKQQAGDTDIFCFQEVYDSTADVFEHDKARPHLFQELKELLPGFKAFFAGNFDGWVNAKKVNFSVVEGQAVFVGNSLAVRESGSLYIYGAADTEIAADFRNEPKKAQYSVLSAGGRDFFVVNVHGKWFPGDKLDTAERLVQSAKINSVLAKFNLPKILCGDLNLMPQTESIKQLEVGMTNLIKQFNISNTRNEVSWAKYSNHQSFADYAFVSPEIKVNSFEVPYNEVSDHLPMILEFEL